MIALFLTLLLVGISAPVGAASESREITCYSGGVVIYHGFSDPIEEFLHNAGAGHFSFRDRDTHKRVVVRGDCLVLSSAQPIGGLR